MMKKLINFCLVFFVFSLCLTSCTSSLNEQSYTLRGAYFGSTDGQTVLLSNKDGSVQYLQVIKNSEYIINISKKDAEKGPFYLIYTFDKKPKLAPEPPYIIANVDLNRSLLLPAILVFDWKFKFVGKEANKLSFEWVSPVFSQSNGAKLFLETSFTEGFPFSKIKKIVVSKLPYETKKTEVDLEVKLKNKNKTLQERIQKHCKNESWYIRMPYHYPEGIDLVYASNSVSPNLCD